MFTQQNKNIANNEFTPGFDESRENLSQEIDDEQIARTLQADEDEQVANVLAGVKQGATLLGFGTEQIVRSVTSVSNLGKIAAFPAEVASGVADGFGRYNNGESIHNSIMKPLVELGMGVWVPSYAPIRLGAEFADTLGNTAGNVGKDRLADQYEATGDFDTELMYATSIALGLGLCGKLIGKTLDAVTEALIHPWDAFHGTQNFIKSQVHHLSRQFELWQDHDAKALSSLFNQNIDELTQDWPKAAKQSYAQLLEFHIGPRLVCNAEGQLAIIRVGLTPSDSQKPSLTSVLDWHRQIFSPLVKELIDASSINELACELKELMVAWQSDDIAGFENEPEIVELKQQLTSTQEQGLKDQEKTICAELKDKKMAVMQRRLNFHRTIQAAQNVTSLTSSLANIMGKPEVAHQIQTVGHAAVNIATQLTQFSASVASGNVLGAVSSIVGSIASVAGIFGKKKSSPEKAIMKAIAQLANMVHQLRIEIHQRFDQLLTKLDNMEEKLNNQLKILDDAIENLQGQVERFREENKAAHQTTQDTLNQMSKNLNSLAVGIKDIQTQSKLNEVLGPVNTFVDRVGEPEAAELASYLQPLNTQLKDTVYHPLLSGALEYNQEAIRNMRLSANNTTQASFYMNTLLGYLQSKGKMNDFAVLPNLYVWMYPAMALLELYHSIYGGEQSMSYDEFRLIENANIGAQQLEMFLRELKNPKIAADLVNTYRYSILTLTDTIKEYSHQKFAKLNQEYQTTRSAEYKRQALAQYQNFNEQIISVKVDYPGWFRPLTQHHYWRHLGYVEYYSQSLIVLTQNGAIYQHLGGSRVRPITNRPAQNEVPNQTGISNQEKSAYRQNLQQQIKQCKDTFKKEVIDAKKYAVYDHIKLSGDFAQSTTHYLFILPENNEHPILHSNFSIHKLFKLPTCYLKAAFLGIGELSFSYSVNGKPGQGQRMQLHAKFLQANQPETIIGQISFACNTQYFNLAEGIWWAWAGGSIAANLNTITETKPVHRLGSTGESKHWFNDITTKPVLSPQPGLHECLKKQAALADDAEPVVVITHENLPTDDSTLQLLVEKQCAAQLYNKDNMLRTLKNDLTSGSEKALIRAFEDFSEAYQLLKLYTMLGFIDDYQADDSKLRSFFTTENLSSPAGLLGFIKELEAREAYGSTQLLTAIETLLQKQLVAFESVLLDGCQQYQNQTNFELFDKANQFLTDAFDNYHATLQKTSALVRREKGKTVLAENEEVKNLNTELVYMLTSIQSMLSNQNIRVVKSMIETLNQQFENDGKAYRCRVNEAGEVRLTIPNQKAIEDIPSVANTSSARFYQPQPSIEALELNDSEASLTYDAVDNENDFTLNP